MKINGIERTLECGKCTNCKKGKAYDWSVRIKNHMAYNSNCCFITLTYGDYKANIDDKYYIYSLSKRDLQLFFKRLRKHFDNRRISYFACGEYGERTARPHYHILLFGIAMSELKLMKCYNHTYSDIIKSLIWTYGNNEVGNVEPASIYYTTGYILKARYNHHLMGNREPEFNLMSKGLGLEMLNDNLNEYVVKFLNRESIPSYYYRLLTDLTGATETSCFDGLKKRAIDIMRKTGGEININSYRKALRAIYESNLQIEKDYITLNKLNKEIKL